MRRRSATRALAKPFALGLLLAAPAALAEAPGPQAPGGGTDRIAPPRLHRERQIPIELGPDLGVSWRPARGAREVHYPPAFTYGVHAGFELNAWLGLRLLVDGTKLLVDAEPDAFAGGNAPEGTRLDQPELTLWRLGARLEPTHHFAPRWRLFSGLGGAWSTIETDGLGGEVAGCAPLVPEAGCAVTAPRRSGKLAELTATLGVSLELLPRRLLLIASGTNSTFLSQTGNVFNAAQAFAGGRMLSVRGVPEFAGALTFTAGLGLIL